MRKTIYLLTLLLTLTLTEVRGQGVTSVPSPLQITSEGVEIYYHADSGTKGLANLPATEAVYTHTGVITDKSANGSDWKYAPKWLDNSPKYLMEYVEENLYRLKIGNIREYYGIPSDGETVMRLAFVFRNATGSKEGKADGGADFYVDVVPEGFQVLLSSSAGEYPVLDAGGDEVTFTLSSTKSADLSIIINGETIASSPSATTLEATYAFPSSGDFLVTGKGVNGKETSESSMSVVVHGDSPEAAYPGGKPIQGAVLQEDGSVVFCLAAPQKKSAMIVGSWNDLVPSGKYLMNYCDYEGQRYFWLKVDGLDTETDWMYYYYVDRTYRVGDPYANLVLDPRNDHYIAESVFPGLPAYPVDKVKDVCLALYNPSRHEYEWRDKDFEAPANNNLNIYELLFRDFTGTEGKALGNGTVRKAFGKLDYLWRLGVNAVELLPINEFNGNISWGYNPNFYFAPDKAYGTPYDYRQFVDECHLRGMAVILDVVFNQADWQHPWYQLYPAGENPFFNAQAPHAYSVLNDWNQGNPLVEQQWNDMLAYWVNEYHVDGFRFDLVKGLGDNDSYSNSGDAATNAYNASRVERMHRLQAKLQELKPDIIFINEDLAGVKEENELASTGQLNWANYNNPGCQFAMGYSSDSSLNGMYAPESARTWGSTVSYLESHDEQRLAYKQNTWGEPGVKGNETVSMQRLGSTAAQMIMSPGAHMIWMFSEMGNAENTKDSSGGNNTDPKIVNWNLLENPAHYNLMETYRELIGIRRNNPDLFDKDSQFTITAGSSNWVLGRTLVTRKGSAEIFTVINPNITGTISVPVTFSKKDDTAYRIMTSTPGTEPTFSAAGGTVTVPANSFVIVATKDVAGIEEAVTDEERMNIAGSKGVVTVEGYDGLISIFRADGTIAYKGREPRIELPAGYYIVRAAGRGVPVIVL